MSWKGGGGWGKSWGGKAGAGQTIKPTTIKPATMISNAPRTGHIKPVQPSGAPMKKPITPSTPGSGSPAGAGGKTPTLTVSSNQKSSDSGVQTLIGDFSEMGSNHGKKYYKKVQSIPGHPGVKVFLYYWDTRDGAEFSGWWFGDELGGSEVWARCVSHGPMPPAAGWKVPWNAPKAEPGLLTVLPYKGPASGAGGVVRTVPASGTAAKVAPSGSAAAPSPALDARVKKASNNIDIVEKSAKAVTARAKTLTKDSDPGALKKMQESLVVEQNKLNEAQKSLTQDITEARKGGPTAVTSVTELSKLSPRLRNMSAMVVSELNKVKGHTAAAELAKKSSPEEQKKAEDKSSKEFADIMPAVKEAVTTACDTVEAVHAMAAPILEDPEDGKANLDSVDKSATEAQQKLTDARTQINTKLQAARAFAPKARATALAEFATLQQKLAEAQKQLQPYKTFKKDFAARVEAKKALADIDQKISNVELEVEKAANMSIGGADSQMSEEEIKAAQEVVTPGQKALATASRELEAKLRTASGPMKDELAGMQSRLGASRKRLDGITTGLKRQQEGLSLSKMSEAALEKVEKAEEALKKCGDAELPFLKGIEVLPSGESEAALKECANAATEANNHVNQARSFISTKLGEARQFSKESSKAATDELMELKKRADDAHKKLSTFKEETRERKVTAATAESIEVVLAAEAKGKAAMEAAKTFFADDLGSVSVDSLKEAVEKTSAAEKVCADALKEARTAILNKQKDSKDPDLNQGLSKLNARLSAVQQEMAKAKKAALSADQIIKGKEVSVKAEAMMAATEAEVEKLSKLAKPDDEGLGVEKVTDESILEMEALATAATKDLKAVGTMVQPHLSTAPASVKTLMTKLIERTKKAHTKISEARSGTKEQREKVLSASYAKEGEAKVKEAENSLEKTDKAEAPYLKGVDVLPLEESKEAMAAADDAVKSVQGAVGAARTFIAQKQIELKAFAPANVKSSTEEFAKLTERINVIAGKLVTFKKDTVERKKKVQLMEAEDMVKAVEAEALKLSEAMKPMMEKDADELSPEQASSMVKSIEELEKALTTKMNECRSFLSQRLRDAQGQAENTKLVQELQTKLAAVQSELAKAKKLSSNHNQKLVAKALIQEATEMTKAMEAELEKTNTACAPVLAEKCDRFLVKVSIGTLSAALRKHMEEKELSEEAMYKQMGKKLTQDAFVAFVGKMPEEFKREECSFSEERRIAMFKSLDTDADGTLSFDEFKAMSVSRFACVHEISVTDVFDIGVSKTLCKLEVGQVVEGFGEAKPAEDNVPRLKCKIVSSGQEGWITTQSNRGTKYLEAVTPFKEFTKELQGTLEAASKSQMKVTGFFSSKSKELSTAAKDSPLVAAREELVKLRLKVTEHSQAFQKLRQEVEKAKREYPMLEVREKNAHLEAKERKEAEEVLATARPKVEVLDAELKKLEEAAKPLTERQGTDILAAFATPLSVQGDVTKIAATLKTLVEDAKTAVKERQELVAKAVKGPLLDAKKELQQWLQKASQALLASNKVVAAVKACCNTIAGTKMQLTATTIRAEVLSQSSTLEALFGSLAPEGERISEKKFVGYVQGLKGLELPAEHAQLIVRQIEVGGVSRRAFMRFLQKYFKVAKDIAITPVFDIVDSKEKPVRKADVDEVVELLEGPKLDEKSGLERVRVKALKDGVEGWVSVKGNQGKTFLIETEKPFYACLKDCALEKDFKSNAENSVRTMKADEVLELIEGPRQETLGSVMRLRAKASDGKLGWVTMADQNGNEFVEKSGKVYTCTATVAITDEFDIKSCKVLKKLAVDEVFTITEGPIKDDSGVERVKGKSTKDESIGWITIKGNAGTTYAKVNEKLYTVKKDVPLQQRFSSDSAAVRTLAVDEAIEVLEGPKEEKFQPANRVKVRASSDQAVGWVTAKSDNLRSWKPIYKYTKAAPLYTAKGVKDTVLREATLGEVVDMLEGPVEVDGHFWIKVQTKKDAAVGWTPLKNEDGVKIVVQAM